MPGNYELYDESKNMLGPVVCKLCWERFRRSNGGPLNTVWVSHEGRRMVFWLCDGCVETLRGGGYGRVKLLRSSPGLIRSPGL